MGVEVAVAYRASIPLLISPNALDPVTIPLDYELT